MVMFAPNAIFLRALAMYSTLFYIPSYIIIFLNYLQKLQLPIATVCIQNMKQPKSLRIFHITSQVHMSIFFLSYTFPSVS